MTGGYVRSTTETEEGIVHKRFARMFVVLTALGALAGTPGLANAVCVPTICYPQT